MATFLFHWLVTGVALWVAEGFCRASTSRPRPHSSWRPCPGLRQRRIRPVLVLVTLPITLLTLGLFYLVVNGLAFGLAAAIVPGFTVDSLLWAILGALVVGLVSWFVGALSA